MGTAKVNGAIKVVTVCIVDVRDNDDRPKENKGKGMVKTKPKMKQREDAVPPVAPGEGGTNRGVFRQKKEKEWEKKQEVLKGDTLSQETTKLELQSKAKRALGRSLKEEALPSIAHASSSSSSASNASTSSDKGKSKSKSKKQR